MSLVPICLKSHLEEEMQPKSHRGDQNRCIVEVLATTTVNAIRLQSLLGVEIRLKSRHGGPSRYIAEVLVKASPLQMRQGAKVLPTKNHPGKGPLTQKTVRHLVDQ